jgi:hypothetical protein
MGCCCCLADGHRLTDAFPASRLPACTHTHARSLQLDAQGATVDIAVYVPYTIALTIPAGADSVQLLRLNRTTAVLEAGCTTME